MEDSKHGLQPESIPHNKRNMKTFSWSSTRIAIVYSEWNSVVTEAMKEGAIKALKGKGILEENIQLIACPGAYEIPLALKMVLDRNKNKMDDTIHGLVALGAVIQGETPHFDVINQGVTQGIMRLMLDTGTPIGFGILTTHTVQQAMDRANPAKGNKGAEAALAMCSMLEVKFDLGH